MSDCPHGDGAHWVGDAGDVVNSLDHATYPTSKGQYAERAALPPTVRWEPHPDYGSGPWKVTTRIAEDGALIKARVPGGVTADTAILDEVSADEPTWRRWLRNLGAIQ